jgi:signal transduction histidine kinase
MRAATDQQQFLLATLPPSRGQVWLALGIVVTLFVAFSVTIPFSKTQLPRVDAFIPAIEALILITDLITSALLFAQFSIARRWGLLTLASGYFFTALIVIPHALTFPGLITGTGLLGAGPQSTAWLYFFWHLGLPLAVIVYTLFKDKGGAETAWDRTPLAAIGSSVTIVLVLVCGLVWIATAQETRLPIILDDDGHLTFFAKLANGFLLFIGVLALALVWFRRRSVLDLWLLVVISAFLIEVYLSAQIAGTRFSLGYYAGRLYSLIAAAIVLIVLLSETTALYAHLARSVISQRGAREARHIAMDAMAASIAHEINQPLAAMVTNAHAALRWLGNRTPDLDEVRMALEGVVSAGDRASGVIGSVRAMFKKDVHGRAIVSANELVREVLTSVVVDLRSHQISVSTDLRDELPQLLADRGQLQQVFLNLIMNAIEAMRAVTGRARLLRIKSEVIHGSSSVLLTVEDSGTGLQAKDEERIFEPFFTTKSTGTGIGLTICRSIIESHGGSLRASANSPHGTIFHVTLPSGGL